ncbi:ATP-binding protein [Bradyrhizobium sp. 150]|uniref:ATP-binding protein n=1 Tax=Bradyrhizobium sp. 150 TaxID=2782625 RepID=UPI001FFA2155|nr:ATP-binding protein [Bradyrhizobium sp. 150]MCK1674984.1 IstB-like ATP-binding domain-containing protein [Bradyrhizobium sp. 150]
MAGKAHAFVEPESNRDAANLSHAVWVAILLDHEATRRNGRRLAFGFVMPG